jgi:hypothetical protein
LTEKLSELEEELTDEIKQLDASNRSKGFLTKLFQTETEIEHSKRPIDSVESKIKNINYQLMIMDFISKIKTKRNPICLICGGTHLTKSIITSSINEQRTGTNLKCGTCKNGRLYKICSWEIESYKHSPEMHIYPADREVREKYTEINSEGKILKSTHYSYIWPGFKNKKGTELEIIQQHSDESLYGDILDECLITTALEKRKESEERWN